jgi:ribosome biogenesis GTPase
VELSQRQLDALRPWGFNDDVHALALAQTGPGDELGRVVQVHYGGVFIECAAGRVLGHPSGKSRLKQTGIAVGDWAVMSSQGGAATVHALLPRRTHLTRLAAGQKETRARGRAAKEGPVTQVIAANCEEVWIVMGCDSDFSLRRLERYLRIAEVGGVRPTLLLTKIDLAEDVDARRRELRTFVESHLEVDGKTGAGVDALRDRLNAGETIALVGSSGVGKSSVVNQLFGRDVRRVGETREQDGRGKHTSTYRELLQHPRGALILDTPGMREVGVADAGTESLEAFVDIERWSEGCRFRDCRHEREPGCAVKQAVASGDLDAARLENYQRLVRGR